MAHREALSAPVRAGRTECTVRLLLIRHAEPVANVAGIVAGPRGCTGLTETGRAQAAALAERLRSEAVVPDIVYSSVLPRAVETAEIILSGLGGAEVVQDCELCELHPGECDGLTWDEQVRRYGPAVSRRSRHANLARWREPARLR